VRVGCGLRPASRRVTGSAVVVGPAGQRAAVFIGPAGADLAAIWALEHTPGALVLPDSALGVVIPGASLSQARAWFVRAIQALAAAGRSVSLYPDPLLV